MGRIFAIFVARNLEFVRDRSSLGWNLLVPVILVLGLGAIFSEENSNEFTVGVLGEPGSLTETAHPFFKTRYIDFIALADERAAIESVSRHQLDLLLEVGPTVRYWINPDSPAGYVVERLLLQSDPRASKQAAQFAMWIGCCPGCSA
jgi:ABC-2 type transport system permease protein